MGRAGLVLQCTISECNSMRMLIVRCQGQELGTGKAPDAERPAAWQSRLTVAAGCNAGTSCPTGDPS